MNRWLWLGSLVTCMTFSTGCLHHNTRGGCSTCASDSSCSSCQTASNGCCGSGSCQSGSCSTGDCENSGTCGGRMSGLMNKTRGRLCGCNAGCGPCGTGPLGWQQGGLDYSQYLNPGVLGHGAGRAVASQPFNPGMPTAQVAYPYYTHRGPRDFLLDNPPSIGP